MANPANDFYSAASGLPVYGGRYGVGGRLHSNALMDAMLTAGAFGSNFSNISGGASLANFVAGGFFSTPPNSYTALVGDSLTSASYELTTATWLGGIADGCLSPVSNIGIANETIANVLSRIDNSYTSWGMSGLAAALGVSKLGWVVLRVGTNDARAFRNWSAVSASFGSLVTKLKGYAENVIILSVPPMTAPESFPSEKTANAASINAGIAAYCASNSNCIFIDDSAAVRVGGVAGAAGISGYFQDGVHMNFAGVREMGIAGGNALVAALASLGIGYSSPLVTSNTDTYASNPATKQWTTNPAMTGSYVAGGGFPGTVVNSYGVFAHGAGAGSAAVIAADVGDVNQRPWQRISPSQGQGGAWTQINIGTSGRAITSGDPTRVEVMTQVRFNTLNCSNIKRLTFAARGNTSNNRYLQPQFWLPLTGGALTKTVIMRSMLPRVAPQSESGVSLFLALEYYNDFVGASIGSFDVRCASMRG